MTLDLCTSLATFANGGSIAAIGGISTSKNDQIEACLAPEALKTLPDRHIRRDFPGPSNEPEDRRVLTRRGPHAAERAIGVGLQTGISSPAASVHDPRRGRARNDRSARKTRHGRSQGG
jgi:hypothetical protein